MKRTNYRNGDEISLACGCDGCNPAMINGILSHETGCHESWKDQPKECFECGCEMFMHISPNSTQRPVCQDCQQVENEDYYEDDSAICEECGNRYWGDDHDPAHLCHISVAHLCPHCFLGFLAEYGEDCETVTESE